ncbi:MAG: amidohydrolase family protein, partial [Bacteroidota bacterium]
MKKQVLLLAMLWLSSLCSLSAQQTYLHCGRLIDGQSDQVQTEMTIIVDGKKITAVNKGYTAVPEGAQAIDLKNRTVMPGLMDMHVHIEGESSKKRYEEGFRLNKADKALRATIYCSR